MVPTAKFILKFYLFNLMYNYLYLICHIVSFFFFQNRCCATELTLYWMIDKVIAKLFEEGR